MGFRQPGFPDGPHLLSHPSSLFSDLVADVNLQFLSFGQIYPSKRFLGRNLCLPLPEIFNMYINMCGFIYLRTLFIYTHIFMYIFNYV